MFTILKNNGVRVHLEKKSGVRVHHEEKSNGVSVHHFKEKDYILAMEDNSTLSRQSMRKSSAVDLSVKIEYDIFHKMQPSCYMNESSWS